ncbi:MAG: ChuX/HutX family heme-like substrate-binding protein [Pseudomonadota bacterium]
MGDPTGLSPGDIRAARADAPKLRERDLAAQLSISEAQLLAAHIGHGVRAIAPSPDAVMPAAEHLGAVMGLTRNDHCVIEVDGPYRDYHPGNHAAMVLAPEIDLRIFPKRWVHGFAVEKETEAGPRRSLQVFDAAGDAVHKIFLRDHSAHDAWGAVVDGLSVDGDSGLQTEPRAPVEGVKINPAKAEILRTEWAKLTDTHQFLRLVSKLKMNRLGAYRLAGAPFVRALAPAALDAALVAIRDTGIEVMMFVGNHGCLQIHTGPIGKLQPMGPWQNVLDPGFNLHLRADRVAEVWAVSKPTSRGEALSIEAFDQDGGIILQIFGVAKEGRDSRPAWKTLVDALPDHMPEGVH